MHRRRASGRPFVAATFAMTVDGKITTRRFSPIDFTSREDKQHLFQQRSLADAVLIGHSTLQRDNVRLGLPGEAMRAERLARGQSEYPLRVVVSNAGRIDGNLNIFRTDISPIVIFSTTRMPPRFRKSLREKATLHLSDTQSVDLPWMLRQLQAEYNIKSVACEGGATLFRSLLEADCVDQLNLTIAPYLFGGKNAPTLSGLAQEFLPSGIRCSLTDMRTAGSECFLTYRVRPRAGAKNLKEALKKPRRRSRTKKRRRQNLCRLRQTMMKLKAN
ncbi:MAG TPA: dihydrofolate reductase family protein [Chthoniobacterales bacterium]|nr:dihydrofolate reductase family protein [Chthoniobacterales bacterium]